ncbi:YceD family protein [Dietzia sp.]|uniref:YceD family protein n=1 Tax=Dietzia sp. TaxID=1871616 RepID=UPI002FDB1BD6
MSDTAKSSAKPSRPAGNFLFDTHRLPTAAGSTADWQASVPLRTPIGVEMVRIPEGNDVDLDLHLSRVEDGVYVSGTVSADAVAECVRCLGEMPQRVSVRLGEFYAEPGSPSAEGGEEEEVRLLDDGNIDLEQALIDEFGLSFDLAPTHESVLGVECPPDSDVPAPDGDAETWQKPVDPRWSGLAEKFGRDPETGEEV